MAPTPPLTPWPHSTLRALTQVEHFGRLMGGMAKACFHSGDEHGPSGSAEHRVTISLTPGELRGLHRPAHSWRTVYTWLGPDALYLRGITIARLVQRPHGSLAFSLRPPDLDDQEHPLRSQPPFATGAEVGHAHYATMMRRARHACTMEWCNIYLQRMHVPSVCCELMFLSRDVSGPGPLGPLVTAGHHYGARSHPGAHQSCDGARSEVTLQITAMGFGDSKRPLGCRPAITVSKEVSLSSFILHREGLRLADRCRANPWSSRRHLGQSLTSEELLSECY